VSGVKAQIGVPYSVSAAEALWYDVDRWVGFVDGFGTIVSRSGGWPQRGSRVIWDSMPGGRGRVVEEVERYEVRAGQVVLVEDEKWTGRQTVDFVPGDGGTTVIVSLEYSLKGGGPLMKVTDLLFIRRALRDSMMRSLRRYALELRDDNEPL
jgi:hypothetical protein